MSLPFNVGGKLAKISLSITLRLSVSSVCLARLMSFVTTASYKQAKLSLHVDKKTAFVTLLKPNSSGNGGV